VGGACSAKRNVYRLLVGEQEGKTLLEKQRLRWIDTH
jgi:hypothetical protein